MSHYFINDENLKHNKKLIEINIFDINFNLYTDSGVFSKDHIDYGTKLLLTNFLKEEKNGIILDLGCGYGIIGITLSLKTKLDVEMVDVNKRAIALAKENIKLNNLTNITCYESNIYANIKRKYNYIITNPPIRAGKETLKEFLIKGKDYLNKNGELWFAMRKDHGVKSMIKLLEPTFKIQIMDKSKGFYVVKLISSV